MLPIYLQLGVALALGLLVGLQREHADKSLAGLRTFPLVTVLGTLIAAIDQHLQAGGWVAAAGFVSVTLLIVGANLLLLREEDPGVGLTTEAALLVMFGVGVYLAMGPMMVAVAIGASTAVLLQFKPELHGFVDRLGDKDVRAIMQFALISAVVLPVLPDKPVMQPQAVALGGRELVIPFDELVPREIWLMVVLIVGLSLGGYLVYKFFGQRAGTLLGGIAGGAISSTAATFSQARQTASNPHIAGVAGVMIAIATTMVYARVLTEIAVVAPRQLPALGPPFVVVLLASVIAALVAWLMWRQAKSEGLPEPRNPTELRSALIFGAMYALVLFALAFVQRNELFSGRGLYAVAALSGLTNMDAITLSTARMVQSGGDAGGLDASQGWRLIMLASMSNLLFKLGIVAVLGHRQLWWWTLALLGVPLATSALLLALWPAASPAA